MVARWTIRASLTVSVSACLWVMAFGSGRSFLAATVLLFVSALVMVPMLEVVE